MKKLLAIVLTTVLLLGLTACGEGAAVTGSGDAVGEDAQDFLDARNDGDEEGSLGFYNPWTPTREAPDFNNLTVFPDAISGDSLMIPSMWVTALGAYYVNISTPQMSPMMGREYSSKGDFDFDYKSTTLLHIIDSATGNDMVLCNRVTCPHDSEDCGAYLPDEPPPPDDPNNHFSSSFVVSRGFAGGGGTCLFVDGDYIYAMNNGRTFYRFNLDGSGRTEYMKLPEKYDFSGMNWIMNGKLYMLGYYMVPTGDFGYSSAQVMLEVDYINKTVKEIFEGTDNVYTDVLGLWDGQIYLMETFYPEFDYSSDGILDYYNNQEIEIFSVNPVTGQRNEIHKDTSYGFMSNAYNINENGEFYFHSRRDETLSRINVRTGVITKLADNLPGFIYIGEERDGRLLLTSEDSADWETSHYFLKRTLYFFDIAKSELIESTLRIKQNVGENPPMDILYEKDGYFYVVAEQTLEEQIDNWRGNEIWYSVVQSRLGRIPKEDYWANNVAALEELDWYDEEAWWEYMLENVYGNSLWARG